jgi:hypothetical protein
MIILLRLLPILVAALQVAFFLIQMRYAQTYPWVVIWGVLIFPLAALAIGRGRIRTAHVLEKMTAPLVLLVSLAFALLLAETMAAQIVIIALAATVCFLSLELLFFLVFNPARYPVNALSRLNLACVPLAAWYAASTFNGLLSFLQVEKLYLVAGMVALGAILFCTTGHAGAERKHNLVWTMVGAMAGAHAGLLGIWLPVSMPVQGAVAAFILSAVLRARRFSHDPKPSPRQAWIEGTIAAALLVVLLGTAKWL